jgi:predicted dehydrogenase
MRTATGALITSSVTLGAAGNSSRLRMCFEHVTVTSGTEPYQIGAGPWTFEATDSSRQGEIDAATRQVPEVRPRFPGLFADVHTRLTGEPDLYLPSIQESYHSIELVTAIYASARERQIVRLPLSADHALAAGWLPK